MDLSGLIKKKLTCKFCVDSLMMPITFVSITHDHRTLSYISQSVSVMRCDGFTNMDTGQLHLVHKTKYTSVLSTARCSLLTLIREVTVIFLMPSNF